LNSIKPELKYNLEKKVVGRESLFLSKKPTQFLQFRISSKYLKDTTSEIVDLLPVISRKSKR
jgi:hypothetical protein